MAAFARSDDLQGAEFVDADLRGARFVEADLSGVVMRGVDMSGADIDDRFLLKGESSLRVNGGQVLDGPTILVTVESWSGWAFAQRKGQSHGPASCSGDR